MQDWLTAKLGKSTQLDTVNRAQQELIKLAQITVGELKQTMVDGMKAAHKDGKLTKEEIAQLGQLLFEKTNAKLSASAMDVLKESEGSGKHPLRGGLADMVAAGRAPICAFMIGELTFDPNFLNRFVGERLPP